MQKVKEIIDFMSAVAAAAIGKINIFFNVTVRYRTIARLEKILLILKTDDEIRFDRAWLMMTPAERSALNKAKGRGLLALRQKYIDKYIDNKGELKPEFFTNRGTHDSTFNQMVEKSKPP
ncbi:MAG: hypothetical protein AAF902_09725 [Chloroflexota bacterium]